MKAKIRDNFDPDMVAKIMKEEISRAMNLAAEAIAGGAAGGEAIGIRSVFTHDSSGDNKPAPAGGPPGVDTGTLRRSFRTRTARRVGQVVRVQAGTDVDYAMRHEFGIGTPQRPFMLQGIESATPYIDRILKVLGPKVKLRCEKEAGPVR